MLDLIAEDIRWLACLPSELDFDLADDARKDQSEDFRDSCAVPDYSF